MFNKKHKALLFGCNDRIVRRVTYQVVGPLKRRLTDDDDRILCDDGTVLGSTTYDRWEQM